METIDGVRALAAFPIPRVPFDGPAEIRISTNDLGRRPLMIRRAECAHSRRSAHNLVNRMYEAKGYTTSAAMPESVSPNRVTFVATEHEVTIGTITVGSDSPAGLSVEEAFGDHVDRLRGEGARLCEFTKFAIDGEASNRVLTSLMHAALLCARDVQRKDKALIEVNPRHARFYETVLGFQVLVKERHNHRVNAPAVLMSLDLGFADARVAEAYGIEQAPVAPRRSLYHHGFSREDSARFVSHLRHPA